MIRTAITIAILLISNASTAGELQVCVKGNKVIASTTCPRGTSALSTSKISALGNSNSKKLTDVSQCVFRTGTSSGSGVITTTAACYTDEYVMTHGISSSNAIYVSTVNLLIGSNSLIGEAPGLVSYIVLAPNGYTEVQVTAFCCRGTGKAPK